MFSIDMAIYSMQKKCKVTKRNMNGMCV